MRKNDDIILMGHGGGGLMTSDLIKNVVISELGNPILDKLDDAACLPPLEGPLAFSTDSYVVDPIFFPGGDIGKLAACGTINDLTMQGAEPKYLTFSLIIQEGFALADLKRIVESFSGVVRENRVIVATGDTKVVERSGESPGIFINTAGIGRRLPETNVSAANARLGDAVIVTGTLGDHGVAILNERGQLGISTTLESDAAALWPLLSGVLTDEPGSIHALRDPTRGGVAAALCDIADSSNVTIELDEAALPVEPAVRGACDLLGLDVLSVANEGKAVIVCDPKRSDAILAKLRSHSLGRDAALIGTATAKMNGRVLMRTKTGGERIVDLPAGIDLPRIC
jgi:hydrogenase expression/formation protein HypE